IVIRVEGLDQDAAGQIATSGASGDLREQLEGALGGAKVGQAEHGVGADNANQRDAVEVVALGEHLRADQNVERTAGEGGESLLILVLGASGVAIEASDARAGKFLAQALFEMFGAFTEEVDVFGLAFGALLGH